MCGIDHTNQAQKGVQGLRFLEFHRTTSSRVEARFPRNLSQKNGISCISKVCASWQQQGGFWKVLGSQGQNGWVLGCFGVSDHNSPEVRIGMSSQQLNPTEPANMIPGWNIIIPQQWGAHLALHPVKLSTMVLKPWDHVGGPRNVSSPNIPTLPIIVDRKVMMKRNKSTSSVWILMMYWLGRQIYCKNSEKLEIMKANRGTHQKASSNIALGRREEP